jgi:hypothetical protein
VQGAEPRALYLSGAPYVLPQYKGRGQQLRLGPCSAGLLPPSFTPDSGGASDFALRLSADPGLSLEVAHRKFEAGSACSLWSCDGHPEWAVRWVLNGSGTLSPAKGRGLVLGLDGATQKLQLMAPDSPQRLVLERSAGALERLRAEAQAAAAALRAQARALGTPELLDQLGVHGFAHLPGAIPPHLVRAALREVNRELGASSAGSGGVDAFRAKTFAQRPEVTALFNASVLPHLMARLLGPLPSGAPYHQGSGQLALRFPGDMCPRGDPAAFSPAAFEALRLGWHIDGLPSDFLPGVTSHWGEVHNFDCLVGVLLEDVLEPMSGELCCYPGSHLALAAHFAAPGLLDKLRTAGSAALPTGSATDGVLQHTAPHHCLGRGGDAFLLNYSTAHFVNANTGARIRYAVYFRVRGPAFGGGMHCAASLLSPTAHFALHDLPEAEGGQGGGVAAQIAQDERLARSLAGNNDHTVPPEFRRR